MLCGQLSSMFKLIHQLQKEGNVSLHSFCHRSREKSMCKQIYATAGSEKIWMHYCAHFIAYLKFTQRIGQMSGITKANVVQTVLPCFTTCLFHLWSFLKSNFISINSDWSSCSWVKRCQKNALWLTVSFCQAALSFIVFNILQWIAKSACYFTRSGVLSLLCTGKCFLFPLSSFIPFHSFFVWNWSLLFT